MDKIFDQYPIDIGQAVDTYIPLISKENQDQEEKVDIHRVLTLFSHHWKLYRKEIRVNYDYLVKLKSIFINSLFFAEEYDEICDDIENYSDYAHQLNEILLETTSTSEVQVQDIEHPNIRVNVEKKQSKKKQTTLKKKQQKVGYHQLLNVKYSNRCLSTKQQGQELIDIYSKLPVIW